MILGFGDSMEKYTIAYFLKTSEKFNIIKKPLKIQYIL